ncbi:hypothetical protein DAPPUDRAFT_331243 [Daphnia pulex]|uniref:Uncharacterized protein n=1 Tax=Daphnia pulex TaxID=6669 RepID=E9HLW7_DAPPU|nr:hypothetical protein DAPPUDRAFT_331243 [Daphnia pulex]|eukprot:EFX67267.1 hypothetical protein DAPPUDRAFT_331243 [Daphnia pulex]
MFRSRRSPTFEELCPKGHGYVNRKGTNEGTESTTFSGRHRGVCGNGTYKRNGIFTYDCEEGFEITMQIYMDIDECQRTPGLCCGAFIGTHAQWEALVPRHISRNILDVVWKTFKCVSRFYQWLKALKVLNPFYHDIKIDESPEKNQSIRGITIRRSDQEIISSTNWCSNTQETESAMSTSFVTRAKRPNSEGSGASTSTFHGLLLSMGNANVENAKSSGSDPSSVIEVVRSKEPFNEFLQNDVLMYKAFPHLFVLGKGLITHGLL